MYPILKSYCKQFLSFSEEELALIDAYFQILEIPKKGFLLQNGEVCSFIAFVAKGAIRHFHFKDGVAKNCDISMENSWITDFQSFTNGTRCIINLQATEKTTVIIMPKEKLLELYSVCPKYETFGRLMAEKIAQRATEIAMSLSSDKPEERFQNLLKNQPDIFQRISQKYIASFLGISPESLSRIRKRINRRESLNS